MFGWKVWRIYQRFFLCEESEVASVYADERGALLSRMIQAMEQTEDQVGVVRLPSNLKNGVEEMRTLFEGFPLALVWFLVGQF